MAATVQTLIMHSFVAMIVVMFGATLFNQAILNGNYAAQDYPLAQQAANLNASFTNFSSQFVQTDQNAQSIPNNQDPSSALTFGLSRAASVVGIIWSILGEMLSITAASLFTMSGLVPVWLPGFAAVGIVLTFAFAALGYLLRWFT